MKQFLITLAMLLTLSAMPAEMSAQKHRHHPVVTVKTNSVSVSTPVDTIEGVDAFSDTTSVADDEYEEESSSPQSVSVNFPDDIFKEIGPGVLTTGIWVAFAIIVVLFVVLPVLFIILLFFIFNRGRKSRQAAEERFAEREVEPARPVQSQQSPDSQNPAPPITKADSDEEMWRRSIKHLSIGAGLAIFGLIVGSDTLAGVGVIIACYGGGQAYIAKKAMKKPDDTI